VGLAEEIALGDVRDDLEPAALGWSGHDSDDNRDV
jgi:hypothetical protein